VIVQPRYRGPFLPTTLAVSMTAAASGSSGITVADDDDIDFGTGNFTVHIETAWPDWTPGVTTWLAYKLQSTGERLGLYISAAGNLVFLARAGSATIFESTSSAVPSILDGQNVKISISVIRESSTSAGSSSFYINTSALGVPQSIASAATVSISNTGPWYINGTNAVRNASTTRAFYLYNRALSAAEVLSLCNNGVAAGDVGASQTILYASNFSAGSDGFTTAGTMTYTGNQDAIGGLDDWLKCERTSGGSTTMLATRAVPSPSSSLRRRYKLQIYRPTGAGTSFSFVRFGADPLSVTSVPVDTVVEVLVEAAASSVTQSFTVSPCDSAGTQRVNIGNGTFFYLRAIEYTGVGNTLALAPTGISASGLTWTDSSGNGNNGTLPASGATKVTIRK
jgi:hypothetical protein